MHTNLIVLIFNSKQKLLLFLTCGENNYDEIRWPRNWLTKMWHYPSVRRYGNVGWRILNADYYRLSYELYAGCINSINIRPRPHGFLIQKKPVTSCNGFL